MRPCLLVWNEAGKKGTLCIHRGGKSFLARVSVYQSTYAQCRDHPLGLQALKAASLEVIVAPYEADAQMAFLAISGAVHAVITEDSDLLTYGCPRVGVVLDNGHQYSWLLAVAGSGFNQTLP